MKLNFKDYLLKNDTTKHYSALNEGLKEIKPMIWSNMNLQTALKIAEFSPAWGPQFMYGKIQMAFATEQKFLDFMNAVTVFFRFTASGEYNDDSNDAAWRNLFELSQQMPVQKARFLFKMTPPSRGEGEDEKSYRKNSEKKFSQEFGQIMKSFGSAAQQLRQFVKKDKSQPDTIEISSAEHAAEIFKILKRVDSGSEATEEEVEAFVKSGETTQSDTYAHISGYYNTLFICYFIYDYILGLEDRFELDDDYAVQAFIDYVLEIVIQSSDGLRMFGKQHEYFYVVSDGSYASATQYMKGRGHDFEASVDMTVSVDEYTRWLLKACNALLAPGSYEKERKNLEGQLSALKGKIESTGDDGERQQLAAQRDQVTKAMERLRATGELTNENIVSYVDNNSIATNMIFWENKRKQAMLDMEMRKNDAEKSGNAFDDQEEKKKIPQPLINFKSIAALMNAISAKSSAFSIQQDAEPVFGNPCAERRMRLFRVAEKLGAPLYKSQNWVVSVTCDRKQGLVFGRNKPKVETGDRTRKKIIESANLEDGEGITAENRAIRDGSGPFVADGIGADEAMNETGWCTASPHYGSVRARRFAVVPWGNTAASHMDRYWINGKRLVIMDCRNGRLYQVGAGSMLDENDDYGGILSTINARGSAIFPAILKDYPELKALCDKHGLTEQIVENAGSVDYTDEQLFAEAKGRGLVTKNGGLILRDGRATFLRYRQIQSMFSEYIPVSEGQAYKLFEVNSPHNAGNRMSILPVNCYKLKSACGMFDGANVVGSIILKNTDGIKDMSSMFANSSIECVEGLDTRSAKTMCTMFQNCRSLVYKSVQIPSLDLSSCRNLNYAFLGSGIRFINLKNTDRVETAIDAFKNCFMLEKIPTGILFKSINSGKLLANNFTVLRRGAMFADDFSKMFYGCTNLSRAIGQNKYLAEIRGIARWYRRKEKAATSRSNTLVVHNPQDIKDNINWLYEYNVVRIGDGAQTIRLFSELREVRIQTLDIAGHENIDNLFYKCQITQIDRVVGTDNVKSASGMFCNCNMSNPPAMNFPKLATQLDVYYDLHCPLGIPRIKFGNNIEILQGYNDSESWGNACQTLFGSTADEWIARFGSGACVEQLFKNTFEENRKTQLQQIAVDGEGYITLDDQKRGLAFDIIASRPDVKGIRIAFSDLKDCAALFKDKKLRDRVFPVVDFNHKEYVADEMFREFECKEFSGFKNTENLVSAKGMFGMCGTSRLPSFDVSKIVNGENMFGGQSSYYSQFGKSFVDQEWNFASLKNGDWMFGFCKSPIDLGKVKFNADVYTMQKAFSGTTVIGDVIEFPNVKRCYSMFSDATFASKTIKKISLPSCDVSDECGIFQSAKGLEKIIELNLDNAPSLALLFYHCTSIKVIGRLNAPRATNLAGAFCGATNLVSIMVPNMTGAQHMPDVFGGDCPLQSVFGKNGQHLAMYNQVLHNAGII